MRDDGGVTMNHVKVRILHWLMAGVEGSSVAFTLLTAFGLTSIAIDDGTALQASTVLPVLSLVLTSALALGWQATPFDVWSYREHALDVVGNYMETVQVREDGATHYLIDCGDFWAESSVSLADAWRQVIDKMHAPAPTVTEPNS